MKKWPFIIRIGWLITFCLFTLEYLHPSAIGVRAGCRLSSKYYVSFETSSQKQGKTMFLVNADDNNFSKIPLTPLNKNCLEKNTITHAMIVELISSVDWTFPEYKHRSANQYIHKQFHFEKIYHPPRFSFNI